MLYLLQFTVEYRGLSQPELFHIWIEEAETALAAKDNGTIKELWKVVGERKVYAVIDVETPDKVDQLSFGLPIMKEMGNQVHIEITPIIQYQNFANFLNKSIGEEHVHSLPDVQINTNKEGIFYWLVFHVEYSGLSQDELFRNWTEEAKFVLKTQEVNSDGLCVWKSVGKREVHALLRVKTPEALDALSLDLPIMKKMGDQVQIECKSVRPYKGFYEDMKKRL